MLAIHGVLPLDPYEVAVKMTGGEFLPLLPGEAAVRMTSDEVPSPVSLRCFPHDDGNMILRMF